MVYPALLPLMRTPRLPVGDWTEALADLNGLVRFAERRNLVCARVPSHFNWPLTPSIEVNLSYPINKNRGCLQNSDFLSRLELRTQYAIKIPNFPNCWKSGFLWKGITERCYYCLCRTTMPSIQYPATMSNRYRNTSVCLCVCVRVCVCVCVCVCYRRLLPEVLLIQFFITHGIQFIPCYAYRFKARYVTSRLTQITLKVEEQRPKKKKIRTGRYGNFSSRLV